MSAIFSSFGEFLITLFCSAAFFALIIGLARLYDAWQERKAETAEREQAKAREKVAAALLARTEADRRKAEAARIQAEELERAAEEAERAATEAERIRVEQAEAARDMAIAKEAAAAIAAAFSRQRP